MILVTGDKGCLGSVLTRKLQMRYRGYDLVDGNDITNSKQLEKAFDGIQKIIHLAAIVGEEACSKNPDLAYDVNVLGTRRLVNLARMKDVKTIVMASTCSVYGDCGEKEVDEDSVPKPWGAYSWSKYKAEMYFLSSGNGYSVLRFGSLYGGSLPNDSLPEIMKRDALKSVVTVKDSGSWRPLTHVEDAVRAIFFVLECPRPPKILNVVGENIRKGDLAKLIAKRYWVEVKVQEGKGRSYRVSSKRLLDLGFKFEWNVKRWLNEGSFMETV